jgi:xanthine dehydrogenase accessory factor
MLGANETPSLRRFPLGAAMGQCCGGIVEILFEPMDQGLPGWLADLRALYGQRLPAVLVTGTGAGGGKAVFTRGEVRAGSRDDLLPAPVRDAARAAFDPPHECRLLDGWFVEPVLGSDFHIALFGAGHVGAAVAAALCPLDCNIRWIDSRRGIFRNLPQNVRAVEAEDPPLEVAAMPGGSHYLVMTHSHALDYAIVERVLARGDAAYCGLIGSLAKRRRFEKRLLAQGVLPARLTELTCPIGIAGVGTKKPAEIAIAVAAELLGRRSARAAGSAARTAPELPANVHPFPQP